MKKTTIAINLGGISNRVKCLISMWRLSDKFGRKLILYWPKNHTCGAEFKDLFENNFQEINKEQLEKIDKKDMKLYSGIVSEMPNSSHKYIISNTWRFILLPGEISNKFAKVFPTEKEVSINLKFERIPPDVQKNILHYLNKLKPLKKLQKEIDNFQKKNNLKEMIGVHIRRGDFSDRPTSPGKVSSNEKFIERMKELVKEAPKTKFFLCTDSQEMEKMMEEKFPKRIFKFPKVSFTRTDVQATQEGLIDLLLLSKTKHILGTYRSTFTEMAWWFGGCKQKIEIIVDPKKQKEYFENVEKSKREIIPKIKRIILKLMGRKFI